MEWIELLEAGLYGLVNISRFVLEAVSVFCVIVGFVKTAQLAVARNRRYSDSTAHAFNRVRLRFGMWLALALEFQLGSDVLSTTISPSLEELGKLAVIAVVRTLLNYFLGKEIEAEYELERAVVADGGAVPEDPLA
jgi:uncharacterized membrane protein